MSLSIFDRAWTDMVFEGRNKDYGAYQLRKENPRTTVIALGIGFLLLGFAISLPGIVRYFYGDSVVINKPDTGTIIHLSDIKPPLVKPVEPQTKTSPPPSSSPKPQPLLAAMKPVDRSEASPVETPQNATASTTPTVEGGKPEGTGTTPTASTEFHTEAPAAPAGPVGIASLDKQPEFPGGIDRLREYVGKHFNVPEDSNVEYIRVLLYFVIEPDGNMTNLKVIRSGGADMDKEAIRVLKSLKTKWEPGYIKGTAVRTAFTLPIAVKAP